MTFQPAIYVLMLTQRVQPLVKRRRDLFNGNIELRIQELQAVLSQLGNKVDGLTAFYSATVEEVQRCASGDSCTLFIRLGWCTC
jgi:hypothetical protein